MKNIFNKTLATAATSAVFLLSKLRYQYDFKGFDTLENEKGSILFLPNHPALVDPILMVCLLFKKFKPHPLADEHQISLPVVKQITQAFGVLPLPNLERRNAQEGVEQTRLVLQHLADKLKSGENILLYPAGRLKRQAEEELGAKSAVEFMIQNVPNLRIVRIRQNGLWGSRFSYGGKIPSKPSLISGILSSLKVLILNGFIAVPKRKLSYYFEEWTDFKNCGDRTQINRNLEEFYNTEIQPNTHVNDYFWQGRQSQVVPEPQSKGSKSDSLQIPAATQKLVFEKLSQMSGQTSILATQKLSADLGIDSLSTVEIQDWIQSEFGFSINSPDSLMTVNDVLLAASGFAVDLTISASLKAPKNWFLDYSDDILEAPEGMTLAEAFLNRARKSKSSLVLADSNGAKSYRDLVLALLILTPFIKKMSGRYIGIMLPASVGSALFFLATLMAGKIPVMVNWTMGARNLKHALETLDVKNVLTSQLLLSKLKSQGTDLSSIQERFVPAESLRSQMTLGIKLKAKFLSFFGWASLASDIDKDSQSTAVVLFTSGSENFPKAVPLTHHNILTNLKDLHKIVPLKKSDVMIGILPAFHSFGINVTTIYPLITGLKTVYHPNPTEGLQIAEKIKEWGVTMLVGTPTFLAGILRASEANQLNSLNLAVTGAEKCPESLWNELQKLNPSLKILEGYGITECSPIVSVNDWKNPCLGSIGLAMPSVQTLIVDVDSSALCTTGQTGMLYVRGDSIFKGYLHFDGESPFVEIDNQMWYKTGDLVRQDEEGRFFFAGRLKRFIKMGGEMISLPAIEQIISQHVSDEKATGPIIAVEAYGPEESKEIVLFATQVLDRNTVNSWIKAAEVSPLHNVRKVIVVESIPVLGTGKTDYKSLAPFNV